MPGLFYFFLRCIPFLIHRPCRVTLNTFLPVCILFLLLVFTAWTACSLTCCSPVHIVRLRESVFRKEFLFEKLLCEHDVLTMFSGSNDAAVS